MLRLHRRNLPPSKGFRLKRLPVVFASVTPHGHRLTLHESASRCVCILLACFLTEYLSNPCLLLNKVCAEDTGDDHRPLSRTSQVLCYLLTVHLRYICQL